jgi:DNA-binding transcriptional MerR regulator
MKYRIGDVERILGIPAETLRYFEKKGIIIPNKNEVNNYRFYDTLDLNKLVAYKFFRGMEFSLDESMEMVNSFSNIESIERINLQIDTIQNKIRHYTGLLSRMHELKNSFENAEVMINKFRIKKCPELLLFYNQINDEFNTNPTQINETRKWLSHLPFIWLTFHIPKEEVPIGQLVHWGYAVNTEHIEIAAQLESSLTIKIPSRSSVYTVCKCAQGEIMTPQLLKPALEYIEENHYELNGDVIGCIVNEDEDSSNVYRYFEVWLPINEKKSNK